MRYVLLTVVVAVAILIGCGSAPRCTGNGSSGSCSGNGQGGGPQPSPSAGAPIHVYTISYGGLYNAGQLGTVSNSTIHTFASVLLNGQVGNGAGRSIAAGDRCANTCAGSYFDWFRADASVGNAPGSAMIGDSGFSECGTGLNGWFYHFTSCSAGNRTFTVANVFSTNFNSPGAGAWWKKCVSGQATNGIAITTCNGNASGKQGPGDTGTGTYDAGDIIFSDTSTTDVASNTGGTPPPLVEVASNSAFLSQLQSWIPTYIQHASGAAYRINFNGLARGTNKSTTTGKGSCKFAGTVVGDGSVGSINCVDLANLSSDGGTLEFWCQNVSVGIVQGYQGEFCPWYVNSATDVLAANKPVWDLAEYCAAPCSFNKDSNQVGETANHVLAFYAAYLLTYQPSKYTAEGMWMDLDSHCDPNHHGMSWCAGFSTVGSNLLAVFPIEEVVPTGNMAIGITPYATGAGGNTGSCTSPCYGLDGCGVVGAPGTGNETDSGGIIPYLVASSCGTADDGTLPIGVYANASNACAVNGVNIGPCAWFVNLTNASYVVPSAAIVALGSALTLTWNGTTFQHQVDIGQNPAPGNNCSGSLCVLGDVTATGGGTMSYNVATFTSGTTSMPADSGIIVTP